MIADTQEITCVLCQGSQSTPVIHENGFTGRQCAQCGLIFVSPRPTRREIDEIYEHGDAYLSADFFVQTPEALVSRMRARRDAKLVQRHATGGSLLEIGPGRGTFLAAARDLGFEVFGVELNPAQAALIRDRHGIACAESLDAAAGLGSGQFDVVYHRDVLSHFYDPHEEMSRLSALLKPGGLQIFETGNLGDVDHRYLKLFKAFQYPDHLFFYGRRSLAKLLDQTGFAHVHTYRWSVLPETAVQWSISQARTRIGGGSHAPAAGDPVPEPNGDVAPLERPDAMNALGSAERFARQSLDLLYHGLQLSVGRVAVSDRVPQTLVVVARKR
jgi:2-polyprenyl-3-methyl-5-hydroxy-6-metoxy-1,4-benzoquinol methylase